MGASLADAALRVIRFFLYIVVIILVGLGLAGITYGINKKILKQHIRDEKKRIKKLEDRMTELDKRMDKKNDSIQ